MAMTIRILSDRVTLYQPTGKLCLPHYILHPPLDFSDLPMALYSCVYIAVSHTMIHTDTKYRLEIVHAILMWRKLIELPTHD